MWITLRTKAVGQVQLLSQVIGAGMVLSADNQPRPRFHSGGGRASLRDDGG